MKLGKAQIALLLVTALFVTFTLGFFIGRRTVHAQITTERTGDELARQLPDENPLPDPEAPPAQPSEDVAETSGQVDINRAGSAELERLPGIGPVLAQRIVEWREQNGPFISVEQIKDVEGIGEGKYDGIRDLICVEEGQ